MRIKVLGIGSPFGDDQVGWRVAEELKYKSRSWPLIDKQVHIEYCDRPGTLLIDLMSDANKVFLIDAVITGNALGTVYRFENKDIYDFNTLLSTHHAGIAEALEIGAALNALPKDIILYGIEIGAVSINSTLSKTVELSITEVVSQLEKEILCEDSFTHPK